MNTAVKREKRGKGFNVKCEEIERYRCVGDREGRGGKE